MHEHIIKVEQIGDNTIRENCACGWTRDTTTVHRGGKDTQVKRVVQQGSEPEAHREGKQTR